MTASPAEPEPEDGPLSRQGEPHGNPFDRVPAAPEALVAGFSRTEIRVTMEPDSPQAEPRMPRRPA